MYSCFLSVLVGDYGLGAGVEDVNASRCNEEGVINIEKVPVMVSLDKCDAAQKLKRELPIERSNLSS